MRLYHTNIGFLISNLNLLNHWYQLKYGYQIIIELTELLVWDDTGLLIFWYQVLGISGFRQRGQLLYLFKMTWATIVSI
jgi:hypothetical protein